MDIKNEYKRWLEYATADSDVASELKTMGAAKIEDAFYRDLAFGTVGLRGAVDYTVVNGNITVENGHLTRVDEALVAEQARKVCDAYLQK